MIKSYKFLIFMVLTAVSFFIFSCENNQINKNENSDANNINKNERTEMQKVVKTEAEWKEILTDQQYRILRKKGTERACTGPHLDQKEEGVYKCVGCGNKVFKSDYKFQSGTGWPSFFQPYDPNSIITEKDRSFGMVRTEVLCAKCDGHLGHVFKDGPEPTGLRYCINGTVLKFEKTSDDSDD